MAGKWTLSSKKSEKIAGFEQKHRLLEDKVAKSALLSSLFLPN
jgi:hypothetical protein